MSTETKHTAEPWTASYNTGLVYGGDSSLICGGPRADALADANAARIVACVNACADDGVVTKALRRAQSDLLLCLNHYRTDGQERREADCRESLGAISAALRALGG